MFIYKTFAVFCIFVISLNANTSVLTLDMRNRVVVSDSQVLLKDVVNNIAGDAQIVNELSTLVVMNIGDTNQFRKINRDKLSYEISKNMNDISVVYSGAESTYVRVKTKSHNIKKVIEEIQYKISDELTDVSANVSINYVGNFYDITMPRGKVTYAYTLPSSVIQKRIPVWLDLYVNSKHYQSIPLWFDATIIADVMVANTRIQAGQLLTFNVIDRRKKDISLYKNRHVKISDLDNLRVKRDVRAGEVLTEAVIEKLPPVFNGQIVKVLSKQNNVTIVVDGIALDDGKLGDKVRVQRQGSNRVFSAIVNNPGQVTAIGI